MKKRILASLFAMLAMTVLMMFSSISVSASTKLVYDLNDYLPPAQVDELESLAQKATDETGMIVAAVITNDIGGKSEMVYADDFYDETFGPKTSGVVLVVNFDTDFDYISTCQDALNYYDDERIDLIFDELTPFMKEYDAYGEIKEYISQITYYYELGIPANHFVYDENGDVLYYVTENGTKLPFNPEQMGTMLLAGFIVALVASLIVFFSVSASYKKNKAVSSTLYLSAENSKVTESSDTFIRTYTTKTRIESNSGSGGGGGGSSSHRSSGGGSHGGGGRGR